MWKILNLPIPELQGEINIEMRIRYAGGKSTYKDDKGNIYDIRNGGLALIGRLKTKGKSDYTLDDPESIRQMFASIKKKK